MIGSGYHGCGKEFRRHARRLPGKGQVFVALANHFMNNSNGLAHVNKAANAYVVSIFDKFGDCLFQGHAFVAHGFVFIDQRLSCLIG